MDSSELRPGRTIADGIRLLRPLSSGGMGTLWVAQHDRLMTEVAVKFIARDLVPDPSARERFAREVVAASQVKSPHVVQMLDYGVTREGDPFIVMELLDGQDLSSYLASKRRLSSAEVVRIVSQVGQALTKAHERGIVHRDVKPSNIFLCGGTGEPFVKLLDFGVAKLLTRAGDPHTISRAALGTPRYMSPEQLVGDDDVDPRSDVWSLGVVVFRALTGERPFTGATVGAVTLAIHTLPTPSLRELRPELPAAVDAWFARACARARDERFATVREACDGLAAAFGFAFDPPMTDGPATSAAASPEPTCTDAVVPMTAKTGRRWRVRHISSAVLVLVVVVAAGSLTLRRIRAPLSAPTHATSVEPPTLSEAPSSAPAPLSSPAPHDGLPPPVASASSVPSPLPRPAIRRRPAASAPTAPTALDAGVQVDLFHLPDERH